MVNRSPLVCSIAQVNVGVQFQRHTHIFPGGEAFGDVVGLEDVADVAAGGDYTSHGHNLSFIKMLKAECQQGIKLFFMLEMSII
ncbi:hypothetical protein [Chamaesiphon minutus]|uniref:hypothetical protein n=1 Tax=Chamaesiphon minutus TaxID=1173032 RepID=UPI00030FAC47|nr:hypothetical protein [Chamaesiphon minutus]